MNSPDFSYWIEYQRSPLTLIVTSLFIGIIIASAAVLYHQLFLGGIVRRIISKNAFSKESALTIEDLGYNKNNILIKFALRPNSTFRKTIHSTDGEIPRYYIPEEIRIREEIKFRKKGNSVFGVLLTILVFLAVAYISLTIVPWFTDALKNIIS